MILSLFIDIIKHSESTQNNKFAISLLYLRKEVGMEFYFLHPDEQQICIIVVNGSGEASSKCPKSEVGNIVMQNIQILYGAQFMSHMQFIVNLHSVLV